MEVKSLTYYRTNYHNGKGLTREALAVKATVSFSTIVKMEKGNNCSANSVTRVAKALGVDINLLLKEAPKEEAAQ